MSVNLENDKNTLDGDNIHRSILSGNQKDAETTISPIYDESKEI
jgi:hypothetical protein